MLGSERRRLRSQIANATIRTNRNPGDDLAALELVQLRRAYRVASLEEAIRETLSSDPVPTIEEREQLATLLTEGDDL